MNWDSLQPRLRPSHPTPLLAWGIALAGAFALLFPAAPELRAARISEPDTVIYGRVVERVGTREFTLSSGVLVWKLRTTGPGGRELSVTTRLERLAGGRYSYRLRIPHELLAYDLSVKSNAVALASAGTQVRHLAITLDGRPLAPAADAVDGFTLDPSRRAGTWQVNLELAGDSQDTDGDGVPDDWEDAHGYDKYDPTDAPRDPNPTEPSTPTVTPSITTGSPIRTFAEWRAAWFPGSTGDPNVLGQEDPDGDGVANLLEYAFDLDPTRPESDGADARPRAVLHLGRPGIAFRPRPGATDLTWRVETSDDLFHWSTPTNDLEEVTPSDGSGTRILVSTRTAATPNPLRFFRVRVDRQP